MPPIDRDAVREGVQYGIQRIRNENERGSKLYQFDIIPNALEQSIATALEEWPESLSPRFVRLFAEVVTVATLSRSHYKHPPLQKEDLIGYLGHSTSFFNSFRHQ